MRLDPAIVVLRKAGTSWPSRVLSRRRAVPPSWSVFSTKCTGKPWSARARAAVMPATPPPTTRAAFVATNRELFDSTRLGLELAAALQKFYPGKIDFSVCKQLVGSNEVIRQLSDGEDALRSNEFSGAVAPPVTAGEIPVVPLSGAGLLEPLPSRRAARERHANGRLGAGETRKTTNPRMQ